ncbi:MAG: helix-turn-helix transcriptional regulator [Clostridiales Family XIII bacterium]|jgi:DNA-binding CsgD family transcriptional regulator|nr:helix-turn-helix transcriptional regulator [Clostridiales Family XIII bacterium]
MDTEHDALPWDKIHEFLIDCGSIRNPKDFSEAVVKKIVALIPFDQARVYYVDDEEDVCDEYLLNVSKRWSSLWREYYSKLENGCHGLYAHIKRNGSELVLPCVEDRFYDYTDTRDGGEYLTDYIRPQHLKYSLGFGMSDNCGALKCAISLERVSPCRFTDRELRIADCVQPHIFNLHRNLYAAVLSRPSEAERKAPLTPRESEIAGLIRTGAGTETISSKLFLSRKTVYTHIAHIFEKMDVRNRQELMVKLNRRRTPPLG